MAKRERKAAPETHPNYRPPIDLPPLKLGSPSPVRSSGGAGPLPPDPFRFVATDLLDPSECAGLIAAVEAEGPTKVDREYDPSYRDCSRVVFRSRALADAVYSRLLPLLSSAECESVRPFGFDGDGEWRPFKVNEVVRISRYDAGGHFSRHRDGAFVENDDVRSVYTVLVYLNDPPAFGGGVTRVFLPRRRDGAEPGGSAAPPSPSGPRGDSGGLFGAGGNDSDSYFDVIPRTGSALVMTHDTLHSGEVVSSGRKYVARFDLMFRRLGGSMTEAELSKIPDRALAERLYGSSIAKQRDGDASGSTEDYVRALNLQAKLPSSSPPAAAAQKRNAGDDVLSDHLDENSIVEVLRFLEVKDIVRASRTSRNWRSVCSSGLLWRELFLLRWPALSNAESTVLGDAEAQCIASAAYDDPANVEGRRRWLHTVFVAVLRKKKEKAGISGISVDIDSQAKLKKELYGGQGVPNGYMFSALRMTKRLDKLINGDLALGWKRFHAYVRCGAIHFAEYSELAEQQEAKRVYPWSREEAQAYDASQDADIDVPPPIPIEHDTDISFSFRSVGSERSRKVVDTCLVKLLGTDRRYLAVCQDDPRIEDPKEVNWGRCTFSGVLDDIARIVVARQTEGALRYGNVSVKCDAKTKQWRAAYARRHIAERYFDVVTIDIGQKRTKFAANATVEDALMDHRGWTGGRHMLSEGSFASQLCDVFTFFKFAAKKYTPDADFPDQGAQKALHQIAESGDASALIAKAMDDPTLRGLMPPVLSEARHGCGSFASAICQTRGHLWSAGHGLRNHDVGDMCVGLEHSSIPFDSHGAPDSGVMAVICAHVVERTFARRAHRSNHFIRVTCAEHPVNVVEPALGLPEWVKTQLTRKLASFQVPFVGFVNGATAALMCGEEPRQDGIVAMLGGVNSAVVRVEGGVADVANGVRLHCCSDDDVPDDPGAVAKEVCAAVQLLLASDGGASGDPSIPVLMTGGRASDAVIVWLKNLAMHTQFYIASREGERHLDAVRGAQILANLSDGRKYFRTALHLMWTLNDDEFSDREDR